MHEYHKLFCSAYHKSMYKSLFFFILTIGSCQPLLCTMVSAPGRAGGVKPIRILHSSCCENSCHLCELPELLVFFVVSFRNHYILCKGKELKHAELTSRQSGGEEGRVPSPHQCKGRTFQTVYCCYALVLFLIVLISR